MQHWFDLSAGGWKLERFRDDEGAYLKISLTRSDKLERASAHADEIAAAGWFEGGENAFVFKAMVSRFSEIKDLLKPFVEEREIQIAPIENLKQGESVYRGAWHREMTAQAETTSLQLLGIPDSLRDSILARVRAAQSLSMPSPSGKPAFDGRLIDLWREMVPRFGWADATAIARMGVDFAAKQGEKFRQVEAEILEAAATGRAPPTLGLAGGSSSILGNPIKIRDRVTALERSGERNAEALIYGELLLSYWSKVSNTVLDGADFRAPSADLERLSGGEPIRFEPSIPDFVRIETVQRLNAAMTTVQDVMGLPKDNRFSHPMRFQITRHGLDDSTNGLYQARMTKDETGVIASQIKYSPWKPGALVHEIGHAVDFNFSSSETFKDKYEYLLDETGITEIVKDMVSETDAPQSYKSYLLHPSEIFARTFETAMIQQISAQNNNKLTCLGGALVPRFEITSTNKEILDVFIDRTREWNKNWIHKKTNSAEAKNSADKSSGSGLQP